MNPSELGIETRMLLPGEEGHSRSVSIRYFNLYRIIVASAFAIFGGVLTLGQRAPDAFLITVAAYWVMAVAFFLLHAGSPVYGERSLGLQVGLDMLMLSAFMSIGGGYHSGVVFVMMTSIAGAGLVGQGRMALAAAALATIAVLADQSWRTLLDREGGGQLSQSAVICVGFFAVAMSARALARRALANEALARSRGFDLARQLRVSARIVEDMQDGIVVLNARGRVRLANPRAERLLGVRLASGGQLTGLVPELRVLAGEEGANRPGTHQVVTRAGKSIELRLVPVDPKRRNGDMLLYIEDMDRLQARAQQIKLAALGRLTANIAHEIRNPLSAVMQASELLREEKRQDVQERLLRIIRDNSARIERMIRDVLELGRRDRLTAENLELGRFCQSFLDEFALQVPDIQHCAALEVHDTGAGRFDRIHLYQILANLLGNARRYCSGGPGCIRLQVQSGPKNELCLIISDDGPGIRPEDRGKVFEPFFTSDPKGTGLGLYMARELAEANGAQLRLREGAGGAAFELRVRRST